jgi:predicted nucleic acid-binding protein
MDSDVMVDLLRQYPPAVKWFNTLADKEEVTLPGYVVMELLQGCRNKIEQKRLQRECRTAFVGGVLVCGHVDSARCPPRTVP